MSRLGFWLAWLLVGSAQAAPVWTLEPALQGWTREGRETELRLRVRSEQAQQARFGLQAGALRFELPLQLQAGQTQRLLLRVPAAAAGLNAQLDGVAGPVPQLRLAERPLLALVSAQGEEASTSLQTVRLEPVDLPHQAAG
ncbi:hypothetical protein, partial [Pseudorhodoferax sp.]|uniref:hypothetical protein n=1 Tax=Pseudorhodoferax sp. TaxID=1993553 RepID=UPI002DD67217